MDELCEVYSEGGKNLDTEQLSSMSCEAWICS